ncbi:MAG: tetratricopeptide repeat protein [Chloroflexi bacterium]|nr:tetratricopeptide repeat protein [Chloroflexota bacterium]
MLRKAAEAVRRSRYPSQISAPEWAFIQRVYTAWLTFARKAPALEPGFCDAWYELSEAALFDGVNDTAEAAYWKALNLQKDAGWIYWWGIQMYEPKWLGNQKQLEHVVRLAIAQRLPDVTGAEGAITELSRSGENRLAELLAAATAAVMKQNLPPDSPPGSPTDLEQRGRFITTVASAGLEASAVREGRSLKALAPMDPTIQHWYGWAMLDEGMFQQAAAELTAAIAARPEFWGSHSGLGACDTHLGDYKAAISEFRLALQMNPDDADSRRGLALALQESGQFLAAIHEYRRVSPQDVETTSEISVILSQLGTYDTALSTARTAMRQQPSAVPPHVAAALALAGKHLYPGSVQEMVAAVDLDPRETNSFDDFARLLISSDSIDAVRVMAELVRLYPASVAAHYGLALALQHEKQSVKAAAQFDEAIQRQSQLTARLKGLATTERATFAASLQALKARLNGAAATPVTPTPVTPAAAAPPPHPATPVPAAGPVTGGGAAHKVYSVTAVSPEKIVVRLAAANAPTERTEYTIPLDSFAASDVSVLPADDQHPAIRVRIACGPASISILAAGSTAPVEHTQVWVDLGFDDQAAAEVAAAMFRDVAEDRELSEQMERTAASFQDVLDRIRASAKEPVQDKGFSDNARTKGAGGAGNGAV